MDSEPDFKPFVGENYQSPKIFGGRRLLVLGESHYLKSADIRPDFVKTLLADVSRNRLMRGWRTRYYRNLFYVLTGKRNHEVSDSEWKDVWDSLAFYNFVQSSRLTKPLMRPTIVEWESSIPPFRTVLSCLRPELIIITGHALNGYVMRINGIKSAKDIIGVWIPVDKNAYAFARCIFHPSSMRFLSKREEQRKLIAEMLRGDWTTPTL